MKILVSGQYNRMYRYLCTKDPDAVETILKRVLLFRKNPKDTRLHTHALKKRMRGRYAFSITKDLRIIFMWIGKSTARFLAIGRHTDVYDR